MSAERFFTPLLESDASGRQWLGALLAASPRGVDRFGPEVVEMPGPLSMSLSVRGISGRLGAFEYPQAPSRELLAWWVDHPEQLVWPDGAQMSDQTRRLRQALLMDEPEGSRTRAQERAHELLRTRSVLSEEWWRFEPLGSLECLLMTDRLVLTIATDASDPRDPATPWYPARPRLVRDIEAARSLAAGRQWGCLLLSEDRLEIGDELLGDRALGAAAPHLDPAERSELRAAYLGNLTWAQAAAALTD